jgi:hypothetical protein
MSQGARFCPMGKAQIAPAFLAPAFLLDTPNYFRLNIRRVSK